MIKLFIADDEQIVIDGIKESIPWQDYGVEVAGWANNGSEALARALEIKPEIIISDIKMPGLNGLEENLPVLREHFLNSLIMGKIKADCESENRLQTYCINLSERNTGVMACKMDSRKLPVEMEWEKQSQLVYLRISELVHEFMPPGLRTVTFQSYGQEVVTIFSAEDIYELSVQSVVKAGERIRDRIFSEMNVSISVGIGRVYFNINHISLSYRDAVRALNYRLVYGDNSVIYIDHVEKTNHEILNLMNRIHDHMEYFKNVLATGKAEEAFLVLDKITGKLQNNPNITYHYIQQVYVQLLSIVLRTVIELNIAPEAVTEKISDLYEGLFTKESYNELNQWFRGIIAKTCEEITKKMSARNKHTIQKALEYMKQHCHENISQTDVAEHICLNASYFSRYFRDETGFSFMDYMKKLRIEKAKELLKSGNMKVYEISEALGYQSVQYFSTLFKGLVGLKPQEYKETAGNEGRG